MKLYVGTYTHSFGDKKPNGSKGIYLCDLNEETGALEILNTFSTSMNPSFIRLSKDGKYLIAANETARPGRLDMFKVEENKDLTLVDQVELDGVACCYAMISEDNSFAAGVHYGSGEQFTFALDEEMHFVKKSFSHTNGIPAVTNARQDGPHAHSSREIKALGVLVYCDLGNDRVDIYDCGKGGELTLNEKLSIDAPRGVGPRHTEFSADGENLYVACELSSEVLFYKLVDGKYELRQQLSTLPEDFKEFNLVADIHYSPDKKFLYVSNRGHDSVAEYLVAEDGSLTLNKIAKIHGNMPRNIAVMDKFVLCANQDSGNVTIVKRTEEGVTEELLSDTKIPAAVCIELID